MSKTIRNHTAQEKVRYRVPRSVQSVIPIERIWDDGIFYSGSKYAKCYRFSDINFNMASEEDKRTTLEKYAELLNSLDHAATTKITINSRRVMQSEIEENILMPYEQDALDGYREELNGFLRERAVGSGGYQMEKYITVSIMPIWIFVRPVSSWMSGTSSPNSCRSDM